MSRDLRAFAQAPHRVRVPLLAVGDVNAQAVTRVVVDTLRENFRVEEEINREAEQALGALGRSTAGMDQHKLMAGLRERIAKKKGFVL